MDFYGVFGDKDRQFPPAAVTNLETLLKQIPNTSVDIRRYEGQSHAFVENLEAIKRGGDAGDAWSGFMSFLQKKIPQIERNREWGQSLGGCDVCASKLNDDPFAEESKQPDAWEEMKKRIEGLEKRSRAEELFFRENEGFFLE